jgi:hypothetical protein
LEGCQYPLMGWTDRALERSPKDGFTRIERSMSHDQDIP